MGWEKGNLIHKSGYWQFSSDIIPNLVVYPKFSSDMNELGEINIISFNNQYVNIPRKHI